MSNNDLVHLHYPWYGGAEWVLLANIFFKTKYILTYHMDALPLGMFKQLVQGVYDRIWAKPLLRRAKKIIAVDREHLTSATFGRFVPAEKIVSVPNGVDTAVFTPDVPRSFPASLAGWELKKIFLFVGNPLPFKRLDFILQVLSRTTDPEIVLAVVSDGYAIESYKNLARELNLLDRVRFVGRAPDAGSLNVYYTVAQSLIIASQGAAESFALVSIEALAAGCPVIASDIPGVRSRVSNGEDGMLFDPNSLEDCQRAIEKMAALSRVERDAMGGQGRLKVRREYAWEKHVERLEAVYSDVMNI